jgi:predicted enzyme related to lactoylglutathione lyase
MDTKNAIRGMATVSFWADDMKAARSWYNNLLGITPYFERPDADNPAYIEYRFGDFQHELGIIDRKFAPKDANPGPGGAVLFWHVDNIEEMLKRLLSMGAREYEPLTPREAGFITASVVDPFGNVLGIMYNPHYLEMLESTKQEQAGAIGLK